MKFYKITIKTQGGQRMSYIGHGNIQKLPCMEIYIFVIGLVDIGSLPKLKKTQFFHPVFIGSKMFCSCMFLMLFMSILIWHS